jgi:hypothetical protein
MTVETISKAEAKARQASQQSQDNLSQDTNTVSIPVIEGLEGSLEMIYTDQRNKARSVVQRVKFEAWRDEFDSALDEPAIAPDFFSNLSKNYSPTALNHVPTPLLTQSFPVNPELDALCDRNDDLIELQKSGKITPDEVQELAELQIKLKKAGVIE